MPLPKDQAWFPAKTFGYGWGLPMRWQGWVVMIAHIAVVTLGGLVLAKEYLGGFITLAVGATGVLIALCYWKGEPASWRWGD